MIAMRCAVAGLLGMLLQTQAWGQTLAEPIVVKQCDQVQLSLKIVGKLHLDPTGTQKDITLEAEAKHAYAEQVQQLDAMGNIRVALRHYTQASTRAEVAGIVEETQLRAERQSIVVLVDELTQTPYSPDGPLTHGELEAVGEHFDTLNLFRLLPEKEPSVEMTWSVSALAVQGACDLDGLIKHEVQGKVLAVEPTKVQFSIVGTVEGIEDGAEIKTTIDATGVFDRKLQLITQLTWKQHDDRKQGPASPSASIDATVELTRTRLESVPAEFEALTKAGTTPPNPESLRLLYVDPNERFRFEHDRDWHIVGQTSEHVMLRLLKDGKFVAQATVGPWTRVAPGKHTTADEFKATIEKLPTWKLSKILDEGELPNDRKLWVYRIIATGNAGEQPIGQTFMLIADSEGRQATVTLTTSPEQLNQIKGRDVAIAFSLNLDETQLAKPKR